MSWFANVPLITPEIINLHEAFAKDKTETKINLIFENYSTVDLEIPLRPITQIVKKRIANDETLIREPFPTLGDPKFCSSTTELILGSHCPAIREGRTFSMQTISGANALRLAIEFLIHNLGITEFSYPNFIQPYKTMCLNGGCKHAYELRYWDDKSLMFDEINFMKDLVNAPNKSVVIFSSCGKNVGASQPTQLQWDTIMETIKNKSMFPIFDGSFQGLNSGDLDQDAWIVRYFIEKGFELFCFQSFVYTFSLHNNPVGNLIVVVRNPNDIPSIKSQFTRLIEGMSGNPSSLGSKIVTYILNNPQFFFEWKRNIHLMSNRIGYMKNELRSQLEWLGTPGNWDFITNQIGMFVYTGLSQAQSTRMMQKHHIYFRSSGQISMCAVTPGNVNYIARAIDEVVRNNIDTYEFTTKQQ